MPTGKRYSASSGELSRRRPPKRWTYEYKLENHELTTTETIDLMRGRVQKRTSYQHRGLKREESYLYGENDTQAFIRYTKYRATGWKPTPTRVARRTTSSTTIEGRLTGENGRRQAALQPRASTPRAGSSRRPISRRTETQIRYDALGRAVQWEYQSPLRTRRCADCARTSSRWCSTRWARSSRGPSAR